MTRLRSCDACARHVFVTETRCPFCQAALEPVSNAPVFNIKAGMSRAQRFTLVAAVASQALLGCSDEPQRGIGKGSGGATQQGTGGNTAVGTGGSGLAGKGGGVQPVYGAPIGGSGGQGMGGIPGAIYGSPPPRGTGGIGGAQAVYGAPVPIDAGAPDASDDASTRDGGGGEQPVYGAPVYGAPIYDAPVPGDAPTPGDNDDE